jgi:hypothetical protein
MNKGVAMRATTRNIILGSMLVLASNVHAAGGGLGCGGGGCVNNGQGGSTSGGAGTSAGQSADVSGTQRSSNVSPGTVSKGGQGSGMSRDMGGAMPSGAQSGKPSPVTKHDAGGSQGW